jgi:hypothetical protein
MSDQKKNSFKANLIKQGKQYMFSVPVKRVRGGEFILHHSYLLVYFDLTDPSKTAEPSRLICDGDGEKENAILPSAELEPEPDRTPDPVPDG